MAKKKSAKSNDKQIERKEVKARSAGSVTIDEIPPEVGDVEPLMGYELCDHVTGKFRTNGGWELQFIYVRVFEGTEEHLPPDYISQTLEAGQIAESPTLADWRCSSLKTESPDGPNTVVAVGEFLKLEDLILEYESDTREFDAEYQNEPCGNAIRGLEESFLPPLSPAMIDGQWISYCLPVYSRRGFELRLPGNAGPLRALNLEVAATIVSWFAGELHIHKPSGTLHELQPPILNPWFTRVPDYSIVLYQRTNPLTKHFVTSESQDHPDQLPFRLDDCIFAQVNGSRLPRNGQHGFVRLDVRLS